MGMTPVVLVVDDDTLVRISLAAVLECHGMTVREASTAADALTLVQAQKVQVAVVDLNLRGQDGQSLILALHAISPDISFIIHSGIAEYDVPQSLRDLGVTDANVFLKPIPDMGLLVARIRELAGEGISKLA